MSLNRKSTTGLKIRFDRFLLDPTVNKTSTNSAFRQMHVAAFCCILRGPAHNPCVLGPAFCLSGILYEHASKTRVQRIKPEWAQFFFALAKKHKPKVFVRKPRGPVFLRRRSFPRGRFFYAVSVVPPGRRLPRVAGLPSRVITQRHLRSRAFCNRLWYRHEIQPSTLRNYPFPAACCSNSSPCNVLPKRKVPLCYHSRHSPGHRALRGSRPAACCRTSSRCPSNPWRGIPPPGFPEDNL